MEVNATTLGDGEGLETSIGAEEEVDQQYELEESEKCKVSLNSNSNGKYAKTSAAKLRRRGGDRCPDSLA